MNVGVAFLLALGIFIGISVRADCQTLKTIGILNIQGSVVDRDNSVRTVELVTSRNQSAGKYRAADVVSCLKEIIRKIPPAGVSKSIIIAKCRSGQQLVFSLAELLPEIQSIPPMLLYRKVVGDLTDTARIQDKPDEPGKVNVKDIDSYLERAVQQRIKLQFSAVKDAAKFLGQPISLIFPMDSTNGRWLANVETLTVAIVE